MMKKIMRVGLDLAKSIFVVYAVDDQGRCQLRRYLRRAEVLEFFAKLEPCLVGLEAGSGSHYWARELRELGHDARIMDPRLVAPYRSQGRTGKNDSNDAAAICEAVGRPQMRLVPIKDVEQQAVLIIHRVRKARVNDQNRVANQLRGLLAEFGIVLPRGLTALKRRARNDREDAGGLIGPLCAASPRVLLCGERKSQSEIAITKIGQQAKSESATRKVENKSLDRFISSTMTRVFAHPGSMPDGHAISGE